jgi:hypothetical protein
MNLNIHFAGGDHLPEALLAQRLNRRCSISFRVTIGIRPLHQFLAGNAASTSRALFPPRLIRTVAEAWKSEHPPNGWLCGLENLQ